MQYNIFIYTLYIVKSKKYQYPVLYKKKIKNERQQSKTSYSVLCVIFKIFFIYNCKTLFWGSIIHKGHDMI